MCIEKAPAPAGYLAHCPMGNFILQHKVMPEFKEMEKKLLENHFQPRLHILSQFQDDEKYILDYLGRLHARRRRANIRDGFQFDARNPLYCLSRVGRRHIFGG